MQYLALLPELLVAVGGLLALAAFTQRDLARIGVPAIAFLFAVAALGVELWQGDRIATFFWDSIAQNRFALFSKAAVLLSLAVWIAASRADGDFDDRLLPLGFLTALGAMLAASAVLIPLLWLGLVVALAGPAIPLLLRATGRRDPRLVAMLAGVVVCGVGLLALSLAFHCWRLPRLAEAIPSDPISVSGGLLAMLALAGALAPLLAIVYSARLEESRIDQRGAAGRDLGAPPLLALLGGPVVVAVAVVAIQIGAATFPVGVIWGPMLAVLATGAALAGGLAGVGARSIRGLVAWLTVAQAGWVVAALSNHDQTGIAAAGFLVAALALAGGTAPFFAASLHGARAGYAGLGLRHTPRSIGLSVGLLSLAGVPPAAGFFGLFWTGDALVRGGQTWVLCGMLLGAGLAAWATIRVLLLLWTEPELEERQHHVSTAGALAGVLGAGLILAFCVVANPMSSLAVQGAKALGLFH